MVIIIIKLLQKGMIAVKTSIKQIFSDPDYAWELLQSEIKIELSQDLNGDDISHLLQLYMRGVERANSYMDVRETFFKNKVTTLMSKPNVIRILNKPMSKKKNPQVIEVSSSSPPTKLQNKNQLQLKQKRKELQMRLAYGAQQHSPQALQKIMAEQGQKQKNLNVKIQKIMDSHEQKLKQRIRQRKIRTMTAKSRSEIIQDNDQEINGFMEQNGNEKGIDLFNRKRDEEQFGMIQLQKKKKKRECKSLEDKKFQHFETEQQNKNRRVSMDFEKYVSKI